MIHNEVLTLAFGVARPGYDNASGLALDFTSVFLKISFAPVVAREMKFLVLIDLASLGDEVPYVLRSLQNASLVFGLGMAITVAPLTTAVMNSAEQQHAGTASGVNNAVARVAGVLAIAVFGSVMVTNLDSHLEQNLTNLMLPPTVVQGIRSREVELAGLELPEGLDAHTVEAIQGAISASFISGFRVVLLCCAGLSITSALLAWRLIPVAAMGESAPVPDERATR